MSGGVARADRIVFLLLLCVGLSLAEARAAAPEDVLRQGIVARLLAGDEAALFEERALTANEVVTTAGRRLDPGLVRATRKVYGRDFFLAAPKDEAPGAVRIAMWVFVYGSDAMARKKANNVRGRYFRHTKILTPFSLAAVDNKVVVVFTESAGSAAVVDFVTAAPTLFRR